VKYRSTLVYFIIALLLTGFYLLDSHNRNKQKTSAEKAVRIFEFQAEQLQRITLTKGTEQIKLEKDVASGLSATSADAKQTAPWRIVAPVNADADPLVLSRLKSGLAELKARRTITDNLNDLASFGLDKPSFTITCQVPDKTESLFFGALNPASSSFYARKGNENKVLLIDIYDKEDLDQSLFNLRDKRIFSIPAEKVVLLVLTRGSETWKVAKKDGQWLWEGDQAVKLDQGKVEAFIRRSTWQEALSFENTHDLKPYGLDKPQAGILLAGENISEQLLIGNPFPSKALNKTYAQIKGKPQIITITTSFISSLPNFITELHERPSEGSIQK
jgi:hypothetical protein